MATLTFQQSGTLQKDYDILRSRQQEAEPGRERVSMERAALLPWELRGFRGAFGSQNVMSCSCIIAGAQRRPKQGRSTATRHSFMDRDAFFLWDF